MKHLYILFFFIIFISCKNKQHNYSAQEIIDKTIVASGANKLTSANVSFKFRGKIYTAKRYKGKFKLKRKFDSIEDILSNDNFRRLINNTKVSLTDSIASRYASSVNSVHYFSVLPYGLNDKAVQKKLLKSTKIKGKDYYKVEISFTENGGGEDFEDVFIYWIRKKDFLIDYLAYSYHTNGGGKRFRALKNENIIKSIRFLDYENYKPKDKNIKLHNLDKAFENNQLHKLSEIILEDIKVNLID